VKKFGLIAIGALIGATLCFFITGKAKVEELVLIAFGALIGAILSFFATEISARRRKMEDEREKKIEIIGDVINYLSEFLEILNETTVNISIFLTTKDRSPQAPKVYLESLKEISAKFSTQTVKEDFYTFQLMQINDKQILPKFKELAHAFGDINFQDSATDIDSINKLRKETIPMFREQFEKFMIYCSEICKKDAPVRTPAAPDKKKDPAKKS
jgi:hypothetical protein